MGASRAHPRPLVATIAGATRSSRSIPGETIGVKDPRLLLVLELWRDLDPRPIGVIRNPVAVRESLERRAHERPRRHPQLSAAGWDELWLIYNRALLAEHRRRPFPVIDFERHADLDAQVRAALAFHGLETIGRVRLLRARARRPGRRRLAVARRVEQR